MIRVFAVVVKNIKSVVDYKIIFGLIEDALDEMRTDRRLIYINKKANS